MATLRYQVSKPVLAGREREYVQNALEAGWISSVGQYIECFEKAVSTFLGLEEGIAVSNGTAALHLACLGLGLGPGMDVIVPSLTFVATANAVHYCGARPIFADSDLRTWNVTRESIEAAWTRRTVGVIAVHLYGLPAPMEEICELCQERGAWVIEDCAEAFGARIGDRTVGSFGDAAAFSFYGNKIISTGEGGMVFVRDPEIRRRVRMLRGQGVDPTRRYWHPIVGYNYRMTNIAAAIGLGQVEMADYHISERRRIAARYLSNLRVLSDRQLVQLPVEPPDYHNVYWLFSVVLPRCDLETRGEVQRALEEDYGIETRPFFVPMHQLPPYATQQKLPNAEYLSSRGLNLPTYSGLSSSAIDEICEAITTVLVKTVEVTRR